MRNLGDTMTGRQRALAAISGERPDRIPCYTPTVACETSSRLLGRSAHTGTASLWFEEAKSLLRGGNAFADFEAQVDQDCLDLARVMNYDVLRRGWRMDRKPTKQLDEFRILYGDPEGEWEIWEFNPRSQTYGKIDGNAPREEPEDWPEKARKAQAELEGRVEKIRETAGRWEEAMQRRVGDDYLIIGVGGSFSVGVTEAAMMACLLEPGAVADLLDCQLETAKAHVDAAVSRGIAVVIGGGDMADNEGLMYAPDLFRELQMPRLTAFSRYCREKKVHYVWRSDGKTWDITDDLFVKAGIEGYGEIDFLAGMEAGALRKRYPELALWGNCAADVLRRGSEEEVYAHCMEVLQGGGWCRHFYGCSNTILAGTPETNIQAMLRAYGDFRKTGGNR